MSLSTRAQGAVASKVPKSGFWLAWNGGMENKIETSIIMGYTGTTIRIHSFIPS